LWLLLEGARVSSQSVGSDGPGAQLIAIGEAMIATYAQQAPVKPKATRAAAGA
jgi:hypothetical protein